MPGHVRQNDTDFTLLQEELNAPILGCCSLILQLAPIFDQLWGTTARKRLGVLEKRKWGSIDLYEVFWPAQVLKR